MKRLPWLRKRKKTDPEPPVRLPIACGPLSNGEGWSPDSKRKQLIRKLVLEKADDLARRHNVDRREFLASACGMATTLYMINLVNGCASARPGDGTVTAGRSGDGGGSGAGSRAGSGGRGADAGSDGGSAGQGGAAGRAGEEGRAGAIGSARAGAGGGGNGGYAGITEPMMDDECLADIALGNMGDELIIDMQTHFVSVGNGPIPPPLEPWIGRITPSSFPWVEHTPGCQGYPCYDRIEYADQILKGSDTTISVLSGIAYQSGPDGTEGAGLLVNEDVLDGAYKLQEDFPNRILTHAMVMPNDRIDVQLDVMERTGGLYTNWKTDPSWSPMPGGPGYWLDGMDDPDMVGPRMIQRGLDLESPIFCVSKGFARAGFSSVHTSPRDIGPAANLFPKAVFVICHSAFEHGVAAGGSTEPSEPAMAGDPCGMTMQRQGGLWPEGPYDDENPDVMARYPLDRGVNSLIKSLRDSNIGPNGTRLDGTSGPITQVYAETSDVWPHLMTGRAEEAMHFWGKLLKHVGEDRIVWGTDCLWFGSPQPVIQAFRCFQISEEFQAKYGYPALTPARKAKILGLNARRLQNMRAGVNITACRHSDLVSASARQLKREIDEEFGQRRDMRSRRG